MTNKVIIVDDHRLFRKGLRLLLNEISNIEVIAEAANGKLFLDAIKIKKTDLVLMDIDMPELNGIEATEKAIAIYPDIKIIALSMYGDESYYYKMVNAGVKGFLLKDTDCEELEKAIKLVLEGNNYFSQELLRNIIVKFGSYNYKTILNNSLPKLSDRELEVLNHICNGRSNQEIAEQLFISPRTVERHRASLLSKTKSKNSINLVMYAIKNDLFKI